MRASSSSGLRDVARAPRGRRVGARPTRSSVRTACALASIYVLWGTSFIGLRVAVDHIAPFLLGSMRYAAAGAILAVAAFVVEHPRRPAATDLARYAVTGTAMFLGGNGLLTYGVQYVTTGTAAVLTSTIPIWMVAFEAAQGRTRMTRRVVTGLAGGLLGVAILAGPFEIGEPGSIGPALILLAAASWAIGSLSARHRRPAHGPLFVTSIQMAFGSLGLLAAAATRGEVSLSAIVSIPVDGWIALAWLVVPVGVVTFASFTYALRVVSAPLVAMYPFVNTVVAVLIGLVIGEPLTLSLILGCAIVLAAAAIIVVPSPTAARVAAVA